MELHNAHVVDYFQGHKGWHDFGLEADHWAAMGDIAPADAAMLLCCHNPNETSFDALSSDETGSTSYETPTHPGMVATAYTPKHLRMLARRLVDIDKAGHKPRTLRDWHQTARENGLAYHTWIDGYMEATAPPPAPAKPPDVGKLLAEMRRAENAKFKPITRVTPGYSYSAPKPPPPINWEYWRLMASVDLWQAVALSVDLNPDPVKVNMAGDVFAKRLSIAESHARAENLPVEHLHDRPGTSPVLLTRFAAWAKDLNLQMPPELLALAATDPTAGRVSAPAPTAAHAPGESASDGPAPLTTNEIANCFAGLRGWDVARWKSELGSPDNWLKDCQHTKGTRGRGGYESTWLPVKIAVALVKYDQRNARSLRARFKKQEPLKPWLDVFEINVPDNSDSQ